GISSEYKEVLQTSGASQLCQRTRTIRSPWTILPSLSHREIPSLMAVRLRACWHWALEDWPCCDASYRLRSISKLHAGGRSEMSGCFASVELSAVADVNPRAYGKGYSRPFAN